MAISGQIGAEKANVHDDVIVMLTLLNRHASWLEPLQPPSVSGLFDTATAEAIVKLQQDAGALLVPDSVVDPNVFNIVWLERASIPVPARRRRD